MWVAGVVALLPLLFLLEEHCRGKWALERWKAQMTARGEKFEIDRLIPAAAADLANGLAELVLAAGQLSSTPGLYELFPPSARFVAPGKVISMIGQSELPSSLSSKNDGSHGPWRLLG